MAVTVLSRCWATSVSTVGTPVMSMMASSEPVSTMRVSSASITSCVRLESSVPIMGTASTPSHSLTTGVDSSSSSCCWRWITSSRVRWYVVAVNWANLSTSVEAVQVASSAPFASVPNACRTPANSGFLSDSTKWLVSPALAPCAARDWDRAASAPRSLAQAVSSKRFRSASAATPACRAAYSSRASLCAVVDVAPAALTSAIHDLMNSSCDAFRILSKTAFSCFMRYPLKDSERISTSETVV